MVMQDIQKTLTLMFSPRLACLIRCFSVLILLTGFLPLHSLAQNAPAGAGTASRSASVPVLSSTYVLTPNDILDISVLGHDDFKSTVTVLPDGMIDYPGVGRVRAAGQTIDELTHVLSKRLVRQILRPQVTVSVRETHPRQISILGQGVHTPGLYNWWPGIGLLDAVAASGGLTSAPELIDATLVTENDVKTVDLVKLIRDGDRTLNVTLQPGDRLLMSLRDPEKAYVQVVGQVSHPGPQPVPPNGATIISVINQAGGALSAAALSKVQVVRGITGRTVNLHAILFNINDAAGQTRVMAGDVVNVPLNDNRIQVFGQVNKPGELPMRDGESLTVTEALAQCDGPNNSADTRVIGIVRKATDGSTYGIKVNADDLLKGKPGTNVVLLPNDLLVVPKRRAGVSGLGALQATLGAAFGLNGLRGIFR